jgi:hypothetical protein
MAAIRPSFGLLAGLCLARPEGIEIRLTLASGRGINVVEAKGHEHNENTEPETRNPRDGAFRQVPALP